MAMKKEMMSWLMTAMRQLVLPIVFCGACVCTSCSSDDDDKSPKEQTPATDVKRDRAAIPFLSTVMRVDVWILLSRTLGIILSRCWTIRPMFACW